MNVTPDELRRQINSADELIQLFKKEESHDDDRPNHSGNNSSRAGDSVSAEENLRKRNLENLGFTLEKAGPVGNSVSVLEKDPPFPINFDQNLRRDVITFLETSYWENEGKYPTVAELKYKFASYSDAPSSTEGWEEFIDECGDALDGRGLPIYRTNHQVIDPFFVLAVNLLCDPLDKRSKAAKLKEAGISTKKFTAMMARKKNADFYRSRMDRIFTNDIEPNAQAALARSVEAGELNAIKFYYEVTDKYRPQQSVGADLGIILTAVMEILARHVEGRVLATIASELSQSPAISKMIGVIDVQNHP